MATNGSINFDTTSIDVEQYANQAAFPGTGVFNVIYIAQDNNTAYRWDGAGYQPVSVDLQTVDIDTLSELNAILTDATLIDTNDSRLTSEVDHYANFATFPGTGAANTLYVDEGANDVYYWDGAAYVKLTEQADLTGYLQTTQIDTLAELNAILTDVNLNLAQNVIYVGAGGLDTKDGRTPDQRVLTLDEAIDKANAGSYGAIYIIDNGTYEVNEKTYNGSIIAPFATIQTKAITAATPGLQLFGNASTIFDIGTLEHSTGDIGLQVTGSVNRFEVGYAYTSQQTKPTIEIKHGGEHSFFRVRVMNPPTGANGIIIDGQNSSSPMTLEVGSMSFFGAFAALQHSIKVLEANNVNVIVRNRDLGGADSANYGLIEVEDSVGTRVQIDNYEGTIGRKLTINDAISPTLMFENVKDFGTVVDGGSTLNRISLSEGTDYRYLGKLTTVNGATDFIKFWSQASNEHETILFDDLVTSLGLTVNGLVAADIDTLSELNAIITDATLIDTNDPRLNDEIEWYTNFASFPGTGVVDILYVDKTANETYYWDGAAYQRLDEEAGAGGQLEHKSGEVAAVSFTSNPKRATVTFSTAFADANYSIQLTALMTDENNAHQPFAYNRTSTGFSISLGSNTTTDLTSVMWTATKFGEE